MLQQKMIDQAIFEVRPHLNKLINHQKGKIFWPIPAVICIG